MLYMVTTIDPDYECLGYGFGVFDSHELAVEAIKKRVAKMKEYELENDDDNIWHAMDKNNDCCVLSFYIESCYINIPLI